MATLLKKLVNDESGQDIAEYAVCMTILGFGVILAIYGIQGNMRSMWDNVSSSFK
jgi:Flp pilus assembly pilin Flp